MDEIAKMSGRIPYSEDDMRNICEGKVSVMSYKDAVGKGSIEAVLGRHKAAIILIETEPNYGHWVALFEVDPHTLEWFDSYGMAPDAELKMVPASFRAQSAQDAPRLSEMIARSRYTKVLYNHERLQKTQGDVSTCGRWAAVRVCMRWCPLQDFIRMFVGQRLSPDQYITLLTLFNK